jgi:hypothetical protein
MPGRASKRPQLVPSAAPLACLLASLAVAAAIPACSSGGGDPADACFQAFVPQLASFRSWTSYAYQGTTQGDPQSFVAVHTSGPRTEYINTAPPHGSTAFPEGTIIVKELGANDPPNHHLFTMVKRGCGFNAGGAKGWEWMEIKEDGSGVSILWRGAEPPAGEAYSSDASSCNSCHTGCTDNDSVCSPKIRLASY